MLTSFFYQIIHLTTRQIVIIVTTASSSSSTTTIIKPAPTAASTTAATAFIITTFTCYFTIVFSFSVTLKNVASVLWSDNALGKKFCFQRGKDKSVQCRSLTCAEINVCVFHRCSNHMRTLFGRHFLHTNIKA